MPAEGAVAATSGVMTPSAADAAAGLTTPAPKEDREHVYYQQSAKREAPVGESQPWPASLPPILHKQNGV